MKKTKNNTFQIETKKLLVTAAVALFFFLILIFIYSKTKHIWAGIPLQISYPNDGDSISEHLVYLEGTAPKAVELTINGNNTFVGESGDFSSPIPIHEGYNIITIRALDKFNNVKVKTLKINGIIN